MLFKPFVSPSLQDKFPFGKKLSMPSLTLVQHSLLTCPNHTIIVAVKLKVQAPDLQALHGYIQCTLACQGAKLTRLHHDPILLYPEIKSSDTFTWKVIYKSS